MWILLSVLGSASSQAVEDTLPHQVFSGRKLWVKFGALTGLETRRQWGGSLAVGFQRKSFLGFDLKLSYVKTDFGTIFPQPDPLERDVSTNFASTVNIDSEINRPRGFKEPWNYLTYGPGISVHGKAFPNFLPLLSESMRVGLTFGKFNDSVNKIAFSSTMISIDAGLQYQLGRNSPWSVEFAPSLTWGTLDSTGDLKGQYGRLPVMYFNINLGIAYWL